jgi:hypothetical protein
MQCIFYQLLPFYIHFFQFNFMGVEGALAIGHISKGGTLGRYATD